MACLALLPSALILGCAPYQETWTRPDLVAASAVAHDVDGATVTQRLLLFGDGGSSDTDLDDPGHLVDPTLRALAARASEIPDRTTVAVLGDTVYPNGVPSDDPALAAERRWAEATLAAQLTAATAGGAKAVLVAGNHDWEYGEPGVDRQADMARGYPGDVRFMPEPGSPGPVVVDIGDEIRLLALDTEWWIRAEFEPAEVSRFRADLTSAMAGAGDRRVIVIAHHPIASHGPHGGSYDLQKRFGSPVPSPIVGGILGAAIGGALSLVKGEFWPLPFALYGVGLAVYMPTNANYRLLHGIASAGQDIHTPPYQRMLSVFRSVFTAHRPFAYASGHEHVLEVLDGGEMADYLLVSGAGSKTSPVKHGANTLFDTYGEGFMILDFLNDGSVTLRVITTDDGPEEGAVAFTMDLDG